MREKEVEGTKYHISPHKENKAGEHFSNLYLLVVLCDVEEMRQYLEFIIPNILIYKHKQEFISTDHR